MFEITIVKLWGRRGGREKGKNGLRGHVRHQRHRVDMTIIIIINKLVCDVSVVTGFSSTAT